MSTTRTFLTRTHGKGRLSWVDWLTYGYLILGFLLILLPVSWIMLNSIKSSAQLERQDIALLPSDYERVARATIYGPDGREIFIIPALPDWVLNWSDLSNDVQAGRDVAGFLAAQDGRDFYALRSHLGQVPPLTRTLIEREGLPDWLLRYPSMSAAARAELDVGAILADLAPEDIRLLSEFLGIEPFQPNRLVTQILVTAPDPNTGEVTQWATPSFDPGREIFPGRRVDNSFDGVTRVPTAGAVAVRTIEPTWSNYLEPLTGQAYSVNVDFASCFTNSVLVTVIATFLTLLINSMAAFALSKYKFRGQIAFFMIILATLMVPPTITLVGVFKAITATGLSGSIWGVIIPGAATPAGVFLLRQYMLTIPDELMEAARMDAASEWKIYWKIILPLALPALAALGILSVIWRWNDLILPLVAIATTKEAYTIQLCLLEFRGEHLSQEHYRLAMTVVSLIPTTLVFVFMQKYITTGIANTGGK